MGFHCRVSEDQTATFKSLVLDCWHKVVRTEGFTRASKPTAAALLEEASKYMAIIKLMDENLIAFYQFYATVK